MKALLVAALRRLATAWRVAGKSGYLRHGPDLHVGKGIRLWAPASIVIGRSVYIGKDVCIEANCEIGDHCLIANRVGIVGRHDHDFSAVGTVIPVQDTHQGRFAGAVFPHQAMDTALGDGEADVGVRLHMSKLLGNAAKFYCWLHRFITG